MNKYLKIVLGIFIILFLMAIMNSITNGLQAKELSQGESIVARAINFVVFIGLMIWTWKGLISNKNTKGKNLK